MKQTIATILEQSLRKSLKPKRIINCDDPKEYQCSFCKEHFIDKDHVLCIKNNKLCLNCDHVNGDIQAENSFEYILEQL